MIVAPPSPMTVTSPWRKSWPGRLLIASPVARGTDTVGAAGLGTGARSHPTR